MYEASSVSGDGGDACWRVLRVNELRVFVGSVSGARRSKMGPSPDVGLAVEREQQRFLGQALFRFETVTLVALLLITLLDPTAGRIGIPPWALIGLYLAYTLGVEFLRNRVPQLHGFTWKYILSGAVSALVYFLGARPGGPLFVLFFLDIACAAASLTLRGSLLYTAAIAVLALIIDPTFPQWSLAAGDVQDVAARLVMLALFGAGTAILRRRLLLEQAAAQSVRDAAERLAELDRLRTDFIASVSHDLRTPLTAARAALVLLATSAADHYRPDEHRLLKNARRNIERLDLLITDLLAYNQLEAGTLHLDRELLDLRAVVTDALSVVYPLIHEKEQLVEVHLPDPLLSEGDPRRLEQVIVNVLANAHRHTPNGTRIAVSGHINGPTVVLSVHDTGPGIPTEDLEGIFQRFYRLGSAEEGSGLGLAIARSIVTLHDGHIWVESRIGAGTTFCIALPHYTNGETPCR